MKRWSLEFVRAEDAGDPHAFRTGVQEYLVRRGDGSFEALRWRWDGDLAAELGALRGAADPALTRRLGDRLREWVGAAVGVDAVAEACRAGEPVELRITSAAAELYALPWELMTLPGSGAHLAAVPRVSLVYGWPAATCAAPATRPRPEGGRIVLAWSRAFGPVAERAIAGAIAAACGEGHVAWNTSRDELADVTLPGLVAALERDVAAGAPPSVLHLLCHGAPIGDGYGLGLDDGRGGRVVVDSGTLARALAPLAGHVRLVVLTACDSGDSGPPATRLGGAAQELHRAGFEAVLASRLPLSGTGALELTSALYRSLLVEARPVEEAVAAARARLLRLPGVLDWASVQLYQHALAGSERRPVVLRPYRGLYAFEERHARFFFGRDAEREEVLGDLEALIGAGKPRLLIVAGASGTGKSSVALAGAVPALAARGWAIAALRPGTAPGRALAEALASRPGAGRLALIVDQLEEVFTHAEPAEAQAFARALWDLARGSDRTIAVIATLRVDYLGRCGELALDEAGTRLDAIAYDEAHRVFVAQLSAAHLTEAIVRPAERVGLRLEAGLCARLLQEIGDAPGTLPLLQHVLDALWTRRADDVLTHAALDAIGGAFGALERHADATIAGLDAAARAQARRLLVRLVAYPGDRSSGTRKRLAAAALRPPRDDGAFERAARALVDARLLRRDDDGAALEVSHEALTRSWRALWDWYQADREQLAKQERLTALVEASLLYRRRLAGRELAQAQQLALEVGAEVRPEILSAVQASVRGARISRGVAIAAAAALLVVITALYVRAEAARGELAASLAGARDMTRIAVAERLLAREPWAAAALLREVGAGERQGWRQASFDVTQKLLPTVFIPHPAAVWALSGDGAWFVAGEEAGALRAYSLAGEGTAAELAAAAPGRVQALDVVEEGPSHRLAVLRSEGLEVWRLEAAGPRLLAAAAGPGGAQVRQAPRGRLAVVAAAGRGVSLWEPAGASLERVAEGLPCDPIDRGELLCHRAGRAELASYADPERGRALEVAVEQVRGDREFGVRLDARDREGHRVHLAWDGAGFVDTELLEDRTLWGNRAAESRSEVTQYVGRFGGHTDALYTEIDRDQVRARICRREGDGWCVPLPDGCLIVQATPRDYVARCGGDDLALVDRTTLRTWQRLDTAGRCSFTIVDPGGRWIGCSAEDGLWLWPLAETPQLRRLASPRARLVGADPRRARFLTAEASGAEVIVTALTLTTSGEVEPRQARLAVPARVDQARFALDGDAAAVLSPGAEGGLVVDWIDLGRGMTTHRAELPEGPADASSAALHAGSRRLLLAGSELTLLELEGERLRRRGAARVSCDAITSLAIAPDGAQAAVGCEDGVTELFALPELGASAGRLDAPGAAKPGVSPRVSALAYAPGGEELAVARADGTITRYSPRLGASSTLPAIHRGSIESLQWTSAGLVSSDSERTVAVWTDPTPDASPLLVPTSLIDAPVRAGLDDARRLLGLTSEGILWTWHGVVDTAGLRALLDARARYCPTATERGVWLGESEAEAQRAADACASVWRTLGAAPRE